MSTFLRLMHTALDALDARELAESYRALLGVRYRRGDEAPQDGSLDEADPAGHPFRLQVGTP